MLTPLRHPWRMVAALMTTVVPCVVVETGPSAAGGEPPTISVSDGTVVEGDGGTSLLQFFFTLSNPTIADVSVDVVTIDGTATAADNDYETLSTQVTIPDGTVSVSIFVAVNGDTAFEPDETLQFHIVTVTNASIADGDAIGTIVNDDEPPAVIPTVSVSDATVVEGDSGTSLLQFRVTLSEPTSETVRVFLGTSDGTATVADNDYATALAEFEFPPGSTGPSDVFVTVNGDSAMEPDETVLLHVIAVDNATIADGDAVGTIVNDDEPPIIPAVSVSDATIVEGDAGQVFLLFDITLSEPTTANITMDVATADGTATLADSDYEAESFNLTFLPGNVGPFAVAVAVNGDTQIEPAETLTLNVTNVVNGTVAVGVGEGTIDNDDEPPPGVPTVSVSDATMVEGDSGLVFLQFDITLSEPTTDTVMMDVATADGTATLADNDYEHLSTGITFLPGSVGPYHVAVAVNGDTQIEPDETLTLNVTNEVDADVADGVGEGTIDNDDAVVALEETEISVVEGNAGTTDAVISGVLSSPLATDLDLPGMVTPGSATAGTDYGSPATASIHIPAGSTSGILSVPVNGDTDIEPDETFDVSFELPDPPAPFRRTAGFASAVTVGGTLVAEVTIVNDDVVVAPTTSTTTTTTAPGPTTPTTTTTDSPTVTTTTTSVPGGILPATRWRN